MPGKLLSIADQMNDLDGGFVICNVGRSIKLPFAFASHVRIQVALAALLVLHFSSAGYFEPFLQALVSFVLTWHGIVLALPD
jgi:predicted membrane chloride channel (bestrophin family)